MIHVTGIMGSLIALGAIGVALAWAYSPPVGGNVGDFDGDGDVDLDDFGEFLGCCAGPAGGLGAECAVLDFDHDTDVDLGDFAEFQYAFGTTPPAGMVFIPAGEYQMGDHFDEGESDELPLHAVYIDAFYMDRYEVTNQQYADALNWAMNQGNLITVTNGVVHKAGSGISNAYCDTTASSSYSRITWNGSTFGVVEGKANHPMVNVSWYGAVAYSNWRSAMEGRTPSYDTSTWACNFSANGYRLPTEAEWEKAARGGLHDPYRRYPWGDTLDGSKANYSGSSDLYEGGDYPWTTPVGYYNGGQRPPGVDMANGHGLYDVAGNTWEWCNDWHSDSYYSSSEYDNPHGPASGTYRVLWGGSWNFPGDRMRCARRNLNRPVFRFGSFGFRLALDSK
jgi:formylglycine-generating enzyme required for sulfatase activity